MQPPKKRLTRRTKLPTKPMMLRTAPTKPKKRSEPAPVLAARAATLPANLGYFLKSRTIFTSALSSSGLSVRSGLEGIAALLPTAAPPSKIVFLI